MCQNVLDHSDSVGGTAVPQAKKKNSGMGLSTPENQIAEVFVVRDHDAVPCGSLGQDILIFRLGHCDRDFHDIVTEAAQEIGDGLTGRFVDYESHHASLTGNWKNFFM